MYVFIYLCFSVPLAAPQILLKAMSPTSIRVTWVPLSKEKAQGVITEYKIQWRRKNQPSSLVEHVKGDMTDYTITGRIYLVDKYFIYSITESVVVLSILILHYNMYYFAL
jgi:Fibronectin type III domain.